MVASIAAWTVWGGGAKVTSKRGVNVQKTA
jgi:hypothetical protein